MANYSYVFNAHPSFIDEMYKKYLNDPTSVEDGWRSFFEGYEFGQDAPENGEVAATNGKAITGDLDKEFGVMSIIHGFRDRGHLLSTTNPIRERRDRKPHLDISDYGLSESDWNKTFNAGSEIGLKNATLRQIVDHLKKLYSGNIGFEYSHIENREKRMWLRDKIENRKLDASYGLSIEKKKRILEKLNGAVVFENFLNKKYVGQKRFSLEGGESAIPALDAIINDGVDMGVEEVVIGMAHRGRLNVLCNILGKTYEHIFNLFEGNSVPDMSLGDGDVKYHIGYSSQVDTTSGKKVHLKLVPNPSHLEAVNTVVEGFSRAKADILYGSDYDRILPILIHGDAAIAGQGIAYETVQMSQLEGYKTGGTLHFVINNQVGFTTDFEDARSSTYCTGVASLVQAPVFHVNGDDPEALVFAAQLAIEYRQKFNNDVFIDMVCYRRHGHNEGDDPKFTQPLMYEYINSHKNPREMYVERLIARGDVQKELAESMEKTFWDDLQARLDEVKQKPLPYTYQEPEQQWRKLKKQVDASDFEQSPKTGITKKKVDKIVNHLMTLPEGFTPLSKIKRLQKGKQTLIDDNKIDWALGELIAYGSILLDQHDVRISGQDVKRGTFSHRHAIFRDGKTFDQLNRFDGLDENQGKFRIFNSLLSEYGVLGFEYGYSLASPQSLVVWEAQFGDFYNGAQVMVDQFIMAGESKWQRMSGLVMLLPHGLEGQGPEHSSARLERFLQGSAEYNVTVTNITTPANFFHALRRQLERPFRKPLINMSPKSILRHPLCVSDMSELTTNNRFQEVIDDKNADPKKVKTLLLCTGKVYYDLYAKQQEDNRSDVAIVRLEQIYPYPEKQMAAIIKKYSKAKIKWVQEEPQNMGAWPFLNDLWRDASIEIVARKTSASPATGFKSIHDEQQAALVAEALG